VKPNYSDIAKEPHREKITVKDTQIWVLYLERPINV